MMLQPLGIYSLASGILVNFSSGNGWSPVWCQAIIYINADICKMATIFLQASMC